MPSSRPSGTHRSPSPSSRRARQARGKRPVVLPRIEALEQRLQLSASPSILPAVETGAQALQKIDHFVVIYQENWSFDGLYGSFPGANGLANAASAGTIPQVDKLGNPIASAPQPLNNGAPDPRFPASLPIGPYDLSKYVQPGDITGDIIHRFYHEQLQIDNGKLEPSNGSMDKFVTWSDNGGLVFSKFDASKLPEGLLAQQYTMDDNFFHAAYGGSFLNAQFLAAAAAPQWLQPIPAGFQSSYDPITKTLNDSNLTVDGKYAVNTTFAAQAPHPASVPAAKLLQPINDTDPTKPGYTPTIGDRLDAAGVGWKWYAGGWNDALAGHADPLYQYHHQPFAYYAKYAPFNPDGTLNPATTGPNAHLQDETNFFADLSVGNLPAVSFIKPLGPDNEHPGYASLLKGQQHVADIVHAIQQSPDWAHTAIIVTYDENGGRWDHVTPPQTQASNGVVWGDGTRVPAIVISPYAKRGFVDHTQHDTSSILKTIEQRFNVPALNNIDANASSLASSFQLPTVQTPVSKKHVLILSVDGLHQADVADPALRADLTNIRAIQKGGVTYTNASTAKPSDSFPGTLSYLTGAGPGTTGVFYDDSYDRNLYAPGSNPATATKGTEVAFAENIDKDQNLLSGGGNFNATSIDPAKLPVDSAGNPVYPHSFLKVNTIFDVAHQAGQYTAFSDKHPAYDIATGHGGNSVNDFYSPEVNSKAALYDPATKQTVSADALRDSDPFADLGKYQLVDASTDPLGSKDPNLELITNNVLLAEKYDDLKVQAILNEIHGKTAMGTDPALVPNLFAMNFQAVSVAEKYSLGGVVAQPTIQVPSDILRSAIRHTDASIGQIVAALKGAGIWNTTELIVTAKHGQSPRAGVGGLISGDTIPGVLTKASVGVAQVTQDDVSLIWLQNQAQTGPGVNALKTFRDHGSLTVFYQGTKVTLPASQVIDQILSGSALKENGLGDPAKNNRTPDIVVTLKPGFIWVGNTANKFKRAEHGGFSEDDTHVALIVGGGGLPSSVRGKVETGAVKTTQIAVTALEELGLDPSKLQGAVIEGTKALPGLKLGLSGNLSFTAGKSARGVLGVFYDPNLNDNLKDYQITIIWGDHTALDHTAEIGRTSDPHVLLVTGRHTYRKSGVYHGSVTLVSPTGTKTTETFTATVKA